MKIIKSMPYIWYKYLRHIHKFSPRNAMNSTLMLYCHSGLEYKTRAQRICKVLNQFDNERKG